MVVSKGQPMRPAEVALLEISDKFSNPPSYEKSGEVIQTDNAADVPLLSLTVHGKSVQDGTPTPDAPVSVKTVSDTPVIEFIGKNLIEFANAANSDRQSYDYTVETASKIEVIKTGSGGAFYARFILHIPEPGNYVLSVGDSNRLNIYIYSDRLWGIAVIVNKFVTVENPLQLSFTNAGNYVLGFFSAQAAGTAITLTTPQIERGTTVTPYEPYEGSSTIIDLQGHELASLPNGTNDVLTLSRNGEIKVVQNVGVVDLRTLDWVVDRTHWVCWAGIPGAVRPSLDTVRANMIAEGLPVVTYSQVLDGVIGIGLGTARYPIANTGSTENAPSGLLYYQLDTPITYTLPSITTPTPVNGGTLHIVANVTPEIDASYVATGMQGEILVLNTCAEELASLDERVTRLENELDNF